MGQVSAKIMFTDGIIGNAEDKNMSLAYQSTVSGTEPIWLWIVKDPADFS